MLFVMRQNEIISTFKRDQLFSASEEDDIPENARITEIFDREIGVFSVSRECLRDQQ